ncbi:MAG: citrate (Si)-synthase [Simkaniaceae bacterium]
MSEILFQITKDHLETGMRGFPVGYCVTSMVDPEKGLFYRGKPISELAHLPPEHIIFLLYHGKDPTPDELKNFKEEINTRARLSKAVVKHIKMMPNQGHPMKLFSAALLLLGMLESAGDYREDCLNVIAKIPHLTAEVINHHAGWGETPEPKLDLGYMENFAHMLQVPEGDKKTLAEAFRLYNILHYDHGGGNLSVFVGKAVASGLEDMYGSLSAAMCGLAGPRHGRANQDCLEFVQGILDNLGENPTEEDVKKLLKQKLENHELIYGFGHAVLRAEDARAKILYDYAKKNFSGHPLIKTALLLRKAGPEVLKENPKISNPYPNIDAISGSMLSAAGFPYSEYYTILFGLARCVGIAIQIVYERCEARDGKGTPIVRPKYIYKPK